VNISKLIFEARPQKISLLFYNKISQYDIMILTRTGGETMRIAICDDEILQLELLKHYVEKWAKEEGINCTIELFKSAESLHFQWLEDFSYDIILLDIQMAKLSGIELAKLIREKDEHIQIIFVTAIPDYIGEGYDVDAINYLIKPIREEKLRECLNKAINQKEIQPKSILVEIDGGIHRIYEDSIMYLEIKGHELFIYQENNLISIRKPLSEMEELLSKGEFIKPHRSYIVALKYIKHMDSKEIILKNGTTIPISRGNSKNVQRRFFDYFKRDII